MKLKLKNFRCHENKEYDFGESGLVLLSGSSGIGKSSLCHAVNFVLYDVGTKIIKYDKTTCSVELIWSDTFSIKRSKRPNRLLINKDSVQYEDDVAQSIIDEFFGIEFDIVSYVQQNNYKSFILMNHSDKLNFIERFMFRECNLLKLRQKCKSMISQANEDLLSVTSNITIKLKKQKKVRNFLQKIRMYDIKTL